MKNEITILAVDDDSEDLELLCDVIKEVDSAVKCITKSSTIDALAYITEHTLPDLILMDINIPKISGIECLRAIRAENRYDCIKVVMFSTSTSDQNTAEIRELNASFVVKPNTYKELVKTLAEIIMELKQA